MNSSCNGLRPPILLLVVVSSLVLLLHTKNKEKSLVLNNKVVPSPATAPKFDRQKACTNISKEMWVDVTAFAILPYYQSGCTGHIHNEGD